MMDYLEFKNEMPGTGMFWLKLPDDVNSINSILFVHRDHVRRVRLGDSLERPENFMSRETLNKRLISGWVICPVLTPIDLSKAIVGIRACPSEDQSIAGVEGFLVVSSAGLDVRKNGFECAIGLDVADELSKSIPHSNSDCKSFHSAYDENVHVAPLDYVANRAAGITPEFLNIAESRAGHG